MPGNTWAMCVEACAGLMMLPRCLHSSVQLSEPGAVSKLRLRGRAPGAGAGAQAAAGQVRDPPAHASWQAPARGGRAGTRGQAGPGIRHEKAREPLLLPLIAAPLKIESSTIATSIVYLFGPGGGVAAAVRLRAQPCRAARARQGEGRRQPGAAGDRLLL